MTGRCPRSRRALRNVPQRKFRHARPLLADIAARQHGIVTAAQLLASGLTDSAISKRVRRGELHRVGRGVYAVGHDALSREGRWLAYVLAGGEGAGLGGLAAAKLWEDESVRGARRRCRRTASAPPSAGRAVPPRERPRSARPDQPPAHPGDDDAPDARRPRRRAHAAPAGQCHARGRVSRAASSCRRCATRWDACGAGSGCGSSSARWSCTPAGARGRAAARRTRSSRWSATSPSRSSTSASKGSSATSAGRAAGSSSRSMGRRTAGRGHGSTTPAATALREAGYTVLRFSDEDVYQRPREVLAEIAGFTDSPCRPPAGPPPGPRRGSASSRGGCRRGR